MNDFDIIKQLLSGCHLEEEELQRAEHLIHVLGVELSLRRL